MQREPNWMKTSRTLKGYFIHFNIIPIVHELSNSILICCALKLYPPSFLHSVSKAYITVYAHRYQSMSLLNLYHQRADITSKAVVEVINKTSEYLQPNPATRAKLSMLNTVSKIRGQVNSPGYPQPEGLLGECMTKYGRDMGEDTNFGKNAGVMIYTVD